VSDATLFAGLAVRALAAAGVTHALLCPGSRSAPLAYALARAEHALPGAPALLVRHDERVAGFTALGVGAGGGLGAVVTTSGTAVANLHPAVLEAHHADRSLVVVTADRPRSLRGTWANQTSDLQAPLFGDAVRARLDLADAEAALDPADAAARLAAALDAARGVDGGRPGPVHLNLGFDEPLVPDGPDAGLDGSRRPGAGPGERPDGAVLDVGPDAVVLAGDGAGPVARAFAEATGLPLLAEPSSGARGGPNAIGPYRLLLELPEFGGAVRRVVAFGRPTLSRPVTRLLARPDVDVVLVRPHLDAPGPGRPARRFASVLVPAGPPPAPDAWLARWQSAGTAASAAIDALLDAEAAAGRVTGPLLARELWAALRPGEALVAAASNPVRDLDLAARPPAGPGPRVHANRGLSGIDGTVSTALGLALGSGGPVRVLVGDVAFLHDAGALLAAPGEPRPPVQVVVLNDAGGGIFSLLEYGALGAAGPDAAAEFERLFGTPHAADLGTLCRGYGVPHERVTGVDALRRALASPAAGTSVVEVPADRSRLRALHARLRAAAGEAAGLSAVGPGRPG